MKEITESLLNAQLFKGNDDDVSYGYRIPYIPLIFHNQDDTDIIDYTWRRVGIIHTEELASNAIQRSYATIYLRNEDRGIQDLIGYWIEIGYGDITTDGYEAVETPRMWVKSQSQVSSPNNFLHILELEGQEDMLRDPCLLKDPTTGERTSAPYHHTFYTESTIYDILTSVLSSVGSDGIYLSSFYDDDGVIDTLLPQFHINETLMIPTLGEEETVSSSSPHETYQGVSVRLLWMTYQYMIAQASSAIFSGGKPWYKLVFPQDTDPIDEEYYSYKSPWFYEFVHRENLVDPNNFLVYCNIDPLTGLFLDPVIIGNARDDEAYEKYPKIKITWAADIDSQSDANTRADVLLSRSRMQSRGGRLLIPHDTRVELLDVVKVYDDRAR